MSAPDVSHGRGGAGNITPDDTQYVDGEVVRVGAEGSHGDGAYSTGRGGTEIPSHPSPLDRRRGITNSHLPLSPFPNKHGPGQ